MFEKLGSRKLLSHTIEEQIERAIQDRKLAPGDRLPTELELCEEFGVSRTVMREALRGLSAKGLVSIEKGRGMFIKEVSASSVTNPMRLYLALNSQGVLALDVVHARQAIEPSIAAMAALNRTPEMLRDLGENLQKLIALERDFVGLAGLDSEFHLLVAKASNNPIMPLVIEPIHKLMPQIQMAVYDAVEGAKDAAVEYHTKILEAITVRDEEAARRWMYDHLKKAEFQLRQTLEPKHHNAVSSN